MKCLLLLLSLTASLIHAETELDFDAYNKITPTPIMQFRIPEKLEFQTIKLFYKQAVEEYKNANYGASKELLEATVQRTDAFPKAYFYLGVIYGDINLPFKNIKLAKSYYKQCVAHRKANNEIKQICYIKLSWIDGNSKEENAQYRAESKKLGDNYYSKWLDVGDARDSISKSLEMAGVAEDAKKKTDKDIFQRANYLVGE